MDSRKICIASFIVISNLLIAYLQLSLNPQFQVLHSIYTELHYIPLLIGAVAFGMRGALLTFLLTSTCYLAYAYTGWTGRLLPVMETSVHLLVSGTFALLAGFLIDREKRWQQQLRKQRSLAGLGQAIAAIVHDLKNPVTTIMAFARRIREGKGDLETAMKAINDSAQDMERAVSGILSFAKPVEIAPTERDVRGLVERVCMICRLRAEEQGVRLVKDLPDEALVAPLDAFYMERALTNLVTNAIEASRKGQDVIVRALSVNEEVTIAITDLGQGMNEETLQHIFMPFYSKKKGGTGLGLAIAKKIVEEHEGRISVNSHPGVGTRVTVVLPCVFSRTAVPLPENARLPIREIEDTGIEVCNEHSERNH